jgi:hypothetical protein
VEFTLPLREILKAGLLIYDAKWMSVNGMSSEKVTNNSQRFHAV